MTGVPAQIDPDGLADIVTPAATDGFTVIVSEFDEAGLPLTQFAVLVITHTTWSPFVHELFE
jgi:hypothetical protein